MPFRLRRLLVLPLFIIAPYAGAQTPLPYEGVPAVKPARVAFLHADSLVAVGDRLRICSYNIQDFSDGVGDGSKRTVEKARRQARVAGRIIDEIAPDLIVLQEIENADALSLLNGYLKEPFAGAHIAVFDEGRQRPEALNLAVLSRVPIERATHIDFGVLQGRGRPARGLLRFELDLDAETRLLVYVVHLKSNWGNAHRNLSQRYNALQILREDAGAYTAARPDRNWAVLVAGDFNVDPENPRQRGDNSLEPLSEWKDLWLGRPIAERATVPTRYGDPKLEFPAVAFDRMYVSDSLTREPWVAGPMQVLPKGVNISNVLAVAGDDDETASDHYPVYLDLYRSRN